MSGKVYPLLNMRKLVFGVPREYYGVVAAVGVIGFNFSGIPLMFVFAGLAMVVGWVMVRIDPDYMDIAMGLVKLRTKHRCLHGFGRYFV